MPVTETVLTLALTGPGALLAGLSLYLLTLAVASTGRRTVAARPTGSASRRLVVLVPAHDEEDLIPRCVRSLLAQSYPAELFRVVVIADNCTDFTAAAAVTAGAEVMVRDEPQARGKGYALRWAMDRMLAEPHPPDGIVVVDADSVAGDNLLAELAAELAEGHEVLQADYTVLEESGSERSDSLSAGFLLFHRVRFTGRARLGMAANLVGNGMLLSRSVLRAHPWDAFTGVEDLEYSVRLRLAGVRPCFVPAASVAGPGSASSAGAVRQRQRWEGGRFHVVRRYLPELILSAIARRDTGLLDAAVDLATPPLALLSLCVLSGSLLTAVLVLFGQTPAWAVTPWAVGLVAIPAFVVIGLRSAGARGSVWRIVRDSPRFLTWKLRTYVRIFRGHDVHRWDRTDRVTS